MDTLKKLNYRIPEPQIINALNFVPQHRERIFIIGFKKFKYDFVFP